MLRDTVEIFYTVKFLSILLLCVVIYVKHNLYKKQQIVLSFMIEVINERTFHIRKLIQRHETYSKETTGFTIRHLFAMYASSKLWY